MVMDCPFDHREAALAVDLITTSNLCSWEAALAADLEPFAFFLSFAGSMMKSKPRRSEGGQPSTPCSPSSEVYVICKDGCVRRLVVKVCPACRPWRLRLQQQELQTRHARSEDIQPNWRPELKQFFCSCLNALSFESR